MQNAHTIPVKGQFPPPLMTGYEYALAHRVDEKFAWVAKAQGKVTNLTKEMIEVTYQDGSVDRVKLGSRYGVSSGKTTESILTTDYKIGDNVNPQDVVVFDKNFFVRDLYTKGQVLFNYNVLAKVAFMESNDTHEDGCAVASRFGEKLTTTVTKVRTLTIPFSSAIHGLVEVGSTLENDSILCTLVDGVISTNTMFSGDDLDALRELAQNTPRAKYHGKVSNIEVLYYGEPTKNNSSPSVLKLIKRYDSLRAMVAKQLGDGTPETGRLNDPIRINNNPTPIDHVIVKIYIQHEDGFGVGD